MTKILYLFVFLTMWIPIYNIGAALVNQPNTFLNCVGLFVWLCGCFWYVILGKVCYAKFTGN